MRLGRLRQATLCSAHRGPVSASVVAYSKMVLHRLGAAAVFVSSLARELAEGYVAENRAPPTRQARDCHMRVTSARQAPVKTPLPSCRSDPAHQLSRGRSLAVHQDSNAVDPCCYPNHQPQREGQQHKARQYAGGLFLMSGKGTDKMRNPLEIHVLRGLF